MGDMSNEQRFDHVYVELENLMQSNDLQEAVISQFGHKFVELENRCSKLESLLKGSQTALVKANEDNHLLSARLNKAVNEISRLYNDLSIAQTNLTTGT